MAATIGALASLVTDGASTGPGRLRRVLACALAAALAAGAAGPARAQPPSLSEVFRIATGGVDSPSFAVGGLIANGLSNPPGGLPCERGGSCGVPGLVAVAQAMGSRTEAVDAVANRKIDAALAPAAVAYDAWKKGGAGEKLRSLGTIYLEDLTVLVRRDSPIADLTDLKRGVSAVGVRDGSPIAFLRALTRTLGIDAVGVTSFQTLDDALSQLAAAQIDAAILIATAPDARLTEFAQANAVRVVAPAFETIDRLVAEFPFLVRAPLAAGVYGSAEATIQAAMPIQLYMSAEVDPDQVYALTKALWNDASQRQMLTGPVEARSAKLAQAMVGLAVPLHAGAARYYREIGLLPPGAAAN